MPLPFGHTESESHQDEGRFICLEKEGSSWRTWKPGLLKPAGPMERHRGLLGGLGWGRRTGRPVAPQDQGAEDGKW